MLVSPARLFVQVVRAHLAALEAEAEVGDVESLQQRNMLLAEVCLAAVAWYLPVDTGQ